MDAGAKQHTRGTLAWALLPGLLVVAAASAVVAAGTVLFLRERGPAPSSIAAAASTYTIEAVETWVTAPNGNQVYTRIVQPVPSLYPGQRFPALIAIPGGTGAGAPLADSPLYRGLAANGFVVVVFNPEGRGTGLPGNLISQGVDDCNGFAHQDDLKAIVEYTAALSNVDVANIGVESSSFGIAISAGALGRYPSLPVAYLVDQEGPHDNRVITFYDAGHETAVCGHLSTVTDPSAGNVAFWAEREAVRYIGSYPGRYLRMQAEIDHAQNPGYYRHTIEMINAATKPQYGGTGSALWTRVNGSDIGNPIDAVYPLGDPSAYPVWVSGRLADHPGLNITYDQEMAALVGTPAPTPTPSGDTDGDGIPDGSDNCPLVANASQANYDGDSMGDACDPDADNDGFDNTAESNVVTNWLDNCGNQTSSSPIYSQAWPADLQGSGASANKVDISDILSFIAPVYRLGTNPGDANFNVRWDISPGGPGSKINITDLLTLVVLAPPMFNGQKALGGPACTDPEPAPPPIRGRFESTGPITTCGGSVQWNSPDGPLIRLAFNLCGDNLAALTATIVGALDQVATRGSRAMLAIGQGTLLPASWLARCSTFFINSGNFQGNTCLPWDANYQADLRSALVDVIGPAVRGHPALVGVYMTMPTMTNGFEMHFRVDRETFPYPGDQAFRDAYRQVMDIYQQAFDVPVVFEAGHCLWAGPEFDCQTPLELYRYTRDRYGVASTGISLWNCAERFWAGTGEGGETFGAKPLIEEASADGASIGCQTVGSFTNGACRFSDPDVGDYGTDDNTPGDVCPSSPQFNPEGACEDTMRWFAGVEAQAILTARVRGTWAENWSVDYRPTGVYNTSQRCRAAIDLFAGPSE